MFMSFLPGAELKDAEEAIKREVDDWLAKWRVGPPIFKGVAGPHRPPTLGDLVDPATYGLPVLSAAAVASDDSAEVEEEEEGGGAEGRGGSRASGSTPTSRATGASVLSVCHQQPVEAGVPHSLTLFHRDWRVLTGVDLEAAPEDPEVEVQLLGVRLDILRDVLAEALQNPSTDQQVRRESDEVPAKVLVMSVGWTTCPPLARMWSLLEGLIRGVDLPGGRG